MYDYRYNARPPHVVLYNGRCQHCDQLCVGYLQLDIIIPAPPGVRSVMRDQSGREGGVKGVKCRRSQVSLRRAREDLLL